MGPLIKTYQDEENELITSMIDTRFFQIWKYPYLYHKDIRTLSAVEFLVTADCNQICEYCYLIKGGHKLNPPETRDRNKILYHMDLLLNYFIEEKFTIEKFEFFSGEIWHTDFGFEILDKTLNALKRGLKVSNFVIPTNCSFIYFDDTRERMQQMIDSFALEGSRIYISVSVDGLKVEDVSRPLVDRKSIKRNDDFYDKIFTFAKKNNFLFHPMVASSNIIFWNSNYDWWRDMCDKYEIPFPASVMMLEVRSDEWDNEQLEALKSFYRHQLEYILSKCNNDIDLLLRSLFKIHIEGKELIELGNSYSNINLSPPHGQPTCSISYSFVIRLGDLAIIPCHRLSYDKFIFGNFKIVNDKIDHIVANNTPIMMKIWFSNFQTSQHACDVCEYKGLCLRGCFGQQYESTGDPFIPSEKNCKMLKWKYDSLIEIYNELGIITALEKMITENPGYTVAENIIGMINRIKEVSNNV